MKSRKNIEIIAPEAAESSLLSYLTLALTIFPKVLIILIQEYLEITPSLLLDCENSLYREMKNPFSCSPLPYISHDFRNNLKTILEAFYNGKPVKIQLRAYDIKQVENWEFKNPHDALAFLIKTGARVLPYTAANVFPYRAYYFSLEKWMLAYQNSYQCHDFPECKSHKDKLEMPDLVNFVKDILTFSKGHFQIIFTTAELKYLKNLVSVVMRIDLSFSLSSTNLEAFLIHALNLPDHTCLSVFILENISDGPGFEIYVDNKYPQALQYLTQLKQKISPLERRNVNVGDISALTGFPLVIADLILQYYLVEVGRLIRTVQDLNGSLSNKWSMRRPPMSSYLTILWAIQYEVRISLIPRCQGIVFFDLTSFADDPMMALSQLLRRSKGLLSHFEKYHMELEPNVRLAMDNLLKDSLNLTQTQIHLTSFSFFPLIVDKQTRVKLPLVSNSSSCLIM